MAKKQTPEELRERAKKLIQQARELENARVLKAGEITKKHMENDFADVEAFKEEIKSVFEEA